MTDIQLFMFQKSSKELGSTTKRFKKMGVTDFLESELIFVQTKK